MAPSSPHRCWRTLPLRKVKGICCLWLASLTVFAAEEMPAWSEADAAKYAKPGSFKLGGDLFPEGDLAAPPPGAAPTTDRVAQVPDAPAPTLGNDRPPVLTMRTPDFAPNPLPVPEALPNVEGELRDSYFALRPTHYLVDPQGLLTEQRTYEVQRYLEYHAEAADIDIYLLVFGLNQNVPSDISLRELHQRWFGDQPAVLVTYHLDHPSKSQIEYGSRISQTMREDSLRLVLQRCLREAQIADEPQDQVERFTLELSTSLADVSAEFRRLSGGGFPAVAGSAPLNIPVAGQANGGVRAHQDIPDPVPVTVEVPELVQSGRQAGMPLLAYWPIAAGAAGVLGMFGFGGLTLARFRRRDSLDGEPVIFPERELPMRLGGSYSGGGFVSMSYDVDHAPKNPD
ncbi:MAG: hypothetical protein AB7I98_09995 [Verrucomicrobiales bacterium]